MGLANDAAGRAVIVPLLLLDNLIGFDGLVESMNGRSVAGHVGDTKDRAVRSSSLVAWQAVSRLHSALNLQGEWERRGVYVGGRGGPDPVSGSAHPSSIYARIPAA